MNYNPRILRNEEVDKQVFEAAKEGKEAVLYTDDVMTDQQDKMSFKVTAKHTFYQLRNAEDLNYAKNTFEEVTGMTPKVLWIPVFVKRMAENETYTGFKNKIERLI
jgi:hypothetical protein